MSTALHDAIVVLTNRITNLKIAGMTVTDGPCDDPGLLSCQVGWSPTDQEVAQVSRTLRDAAAAGHFETIVIDCLLSYWNGESKVPTAREGVINAFNVIDADLAASPELSDTVSLTQIGSLAYLPQREITGALVDARFSVTCAALT